MQGSDKLWCDVLRGKYFRDGSWEGSLQAKSTDSNLWKCIVDTWPAMLDNIYWCVGNGNDISVWNDSWIVPGFKLKDPVQSIPSELSQIRVAELVDDHGHWNLAPIEHLIPQVIRHRIRAIIPPNIDNGIDLKLWPENSHGDFTLASSYSIFAGHGVDSNEDIWKKIWKV